MCDLVEPYLNTLREHWDQHDNLSNHNDFLIYDNVNYHMQRNLCDPLQLMQIREQCS